MLRSKTKQKQKAKKEKRKKKEKRMKGDGQRQRREKESKHMPLTAQQQSNQRGGVVVCACVCVCVCVGARARACIKLGARARARVCVCVKNKNTAQDYCVSFPLSCTVHIMFAEVREKGKGGLLTLTPCGCIHRCDLPQVDLPATPGPLDEPSRWPSGKASASSAGDPRIEPRFARTASLAQWLLRCPPRERKNRGSNPAGDGIFQDRVIPVT